MALAHGTRLGPYEIVAPLGAGGMGEVYTARDTRLGRTVAVKILPAEFAADAKLKIRFEREAKAISALSHPHICALHDVGPDYLVMEYCEGKSLARRLASGPFSMQLVVEYGMQIADALDKAHRAGIVHRDLKPANIMITKSGVKLLDFGLAKQHTGSSPEQSTVQQVTEEGKILGTIQYMAPELFQGKEADARSDIFALGLVLYEMATGKPAFSGTSKASLIAAILEHEPAHVEGQSALDRLIRACLAKNPDERIQSAHDVVLQLHWILEPRAEQPKRLTTSVLWTIAAAVAILMAGLLVWKVPRTEHLTVHPSRFEIRPPHGMWVVLPFAMSPDGQWIAFEANNNGPQQSSLYVRSLADIDSRLIAAQGEWPFFSPDGNSLGYYFDKALYKVALSGGEPSRICSLSGAFTLRGASWGDDGTVLFSDGGKLWHVSAQGGQPRQVAAPPQAAGGWTDYAYPEFLPGSKYALMTIRRGVRDRQRKIALLSLADGKIRELVPGTWARYAADRIIYSYNGSLFFLPFSLRELRVTGEPKEVMGHVEVATNYGIAAYDLSRDGSVIYVPQSPLDEEVVWTDRQGRVTKAIDEVKRYKWARVSPDGKFLAAIVASTPDDIDVWKFDLERRTWTRLTSGMFVWGMDWAPDSKSLVISSGDPVSKLYLISTGAASPPKQLTSGGQTGDGHPRFSPDGKTLLFERQGGTGHIDLMTVPSSGNATPRMFLGTATRQAAGEFSPNGRWVAYESDETGETQIFVCPFPSCEPRVAVSSEVCQLPFWSHDGRELFYYSGSTAGNKELWSVAVRANGTFQAGSPKKVFAEKMPNGVGQASIDDTKFLGIRRIAEITERRMVYAPNWIAEIDQSAGK